MSFRVVVKGLEVICETPQDVEALARHFDPAEDHHERRSYSPRQTTRPHRSIKKLMRELNEKQRALIQLLAGEDSPCTDEALRVALEVEGNKALAGILTGISKRAKRAGIEADTLILRAHHRNGSGERHYEYSLKPEAREEVNAGLLVK